MIQWKVLEENLVSFEICLMIFVLPIDCKPWCITITIWRLWIDDYYSLSYRLTEVAHCLPEWLGKEKKEKPVENSLASQMAHNGFAGIEERSVETERGAHSVESVCFRAKAWASPCGRFVRFGFTVCTGEHTHFLPG